MAQDDYIEEVIFMPYICLHCGKEMKSMEKNNVRCTYCNSKALAKKRSGLAKEHKSD